MLDYKNVELIHKFKDFLDTHNYDIIIQKICSKNYFINPLPNYTYVKSYTKLLEEKDAYLIRLLLLGDKVSYYKAIDFWGTEIINELIKLEVIKNDDNEFIQTNEIIIIPYMAKYFAVGVPYYYPHCRNKDEDVYIGPDSYILTNSQICNRSSKILDLCTGSGIQLITGCEKAGWAKGIGVEYNPNAVPVTKFNVALNSMEDIIEIRTGSLYDQVKEEKFDIIYSNPPFIPVPKGIKYPLCGDGGENGLDIVDQILAGYDQHLNDGGWGIMVGETLGDKEGPFLQKSLKKYISNYDVNLTLLNSIDLFTQSSNVSSLTNIVNPSERRCDAKQWLELYDKLGATRYYSFVLRCQKKLVSKIKIRDYADFWKDENIPALTNKYNFELVEENKYSIMLDGQKITTVDNSIKEFLLLCNGKDSLKTIFAKDIFSEDIRKREQIMEACAQLELMNIICR